MSRIPLGAFMALVVATVGAFFVVQHLKVTTPLLDGAPAPFPAAINPIDGSTCFVPSAHKYVSYRKSEYSFYLLHRSDHVSVYVVDIHGQVVRTIATNRYMRRKQRVVFYWNGREDNGTVAPDGVYHFKVALEQQGRTYENNDPLTVLTRYPRPVVTNVTPHLTAGDSPVQIQFTGIENRAGSIAIYRMYPYAGAQPVGIPYQTKWQSHHATWYGRVNGRPAPPGVYLVGLNVTDKACNTGKFPPVVPPAIGSTEHAGVTVRYLAAEPPLDPVPAGSIATVNVDARLRPYAWQLFWDSGRKPVAHGRSVGGPAGVSLRVKLPAVGAYELSLRSGPFTTSVPLVASASGARRASRLLVVLPALSWQGTNPGDEDGDGIPDTLWNGVPVALARPFAAGLPGGWSDETAFLAYLDRAHLPYDVTTDIGLIDGQGPTFDHHHAVVLAGSETWLPNTMVASLKTFVQTGGHVLAIGTGSLQRTVAVRKCTIASLSVRCAADPSGPSAVDVFGARLGPLVARNAQSILQIRDGLGIFTSTSGVLSGFDTYQPVIGVTDPDRMESAAGVTSTSAAVAGFKVGNGFVVEIGLVGFGSSLSHNLDAQELIGRLWTVL